MSSEPPTHSDDEPTFTSAEVCLAVGLSRPTFDAWMLRGYMSLPPGPGTGRARRFSLTNAVRLAVTAELNRLGVSVSVAARAAILVSEPFSHGERRIGLLLMRSPAPEGDDSLHGPSVMRLQFKSMNDVMFQVALRHSAGSAAFTFLDVTNVAERAMRALAHAPGEAATPEWLNRFLGEQPSVSAGGADDELAAAPLKDGHQPGPKSRSRSRKAAAPKG